MTIQFFSADLIYGLSDSAKAFFIILATDIFVGYHSTYGWEIILENTSKHFGLPENKSLILLFTALPAIMQYSFSPCPLLSKLSDFRMYLIAAVSAVLLLSQLSWIQFSNIGFFATSTAVFLKPWLPTIT
ncbi:hypothetical protein F8S20_33300 [Nostoc sp. BAE]|nr:hypothetical protein [Nostoc commune BAE]